MPHFLCPSCALRAYSAAGESRCPNCDTPLGRAELMNAPLQDEIRRRMRHGESIDDVDLELIERSGLSTDEKAALWLYAWSFVPRRKQRASAELHLRLVTPRG
jgi:hypothetical protein